MSGRGGGGYPPSHPWTYPPTCEQTKIIKYYCFYTAGLAISKDKWVAMQNILKHRVESIKQVIDKSIKTQPEQASNDDNQ